MHPATHLTSAPGKEDVALPADDLAVEFRVLGPVAITPRGGEALPLASRRRRALLAVLLAGAGSPVPVDRLASAVWADSPPTGPEAALQVAVSRLRRALPSGRLLYRPPGYLLDVPADLVDATRFEALLNRALARADTPEVAFPVVEAALRLWSGDAYEEFPDLQDLQPERTRLHELRDIATEERYHLMLELGLAETAVAGLRAAAVACPYRERTRRLLMTGLHRVGRPAEALDSFHAYRRLLASELGLEPSPELTRLWRDMLGSGSSSVAEAGPG